MPDAAQFPLFWPFVALGFGLIVGSFANVCIHRLPLEQSIVTPRSTCPHCKRLITAWENIPILSYVLLLGRCRGCKASISVRYPLVELANGLLYFGLVATFGPGPYAFVMMAFVTAMLILGLIDLEYQILPDVITLPGIAVGLAVSFLPAPPTPYSAFASALGGYVMFMLLAKLWMKMRGIEALGMGDWKLAAMLGAFLGWEKLVLTIFLSSLVGALVGVPLALVKGRNFQMKLPYGTFLCAAGIVAVFVGDPLLAWYAGMLGIN
jgi:leader peptidase (prepilin peptidase) / N-methyltransferase